MFPGVYGFTWDAGNVIFLGLFFTVAAIIGSTVVLAALRTVRDVRNHEEERIRWHEDFHDLPSPLRACRHEVAGEIGHRTCPNAFDCRVCELHPKFPPHSAVRDSATGIGFPVPADRLYHRGHTWVKAEDDGTVLVGLDEFGGRVFGKPDRVALPAPGTAVQVNGTGWQMSRSGATVRVLAPVDGVVVETGSAEKGWFLRLRPGAEGLVTTHLLSADEARGWLTRELESMEVRLGESRLGASLADGGELVNDIPAHYPAANWDAVWGEVFLEP